MARIYPQWISDTEREENRSRRAEYLVYDALTEQLGDDWLVLYSQTIKWSHKHGVSDRDADFIVAHHQEGGGENGTLIFTEDTARGEISSQEIDQVIEEALM